ncbi:hypothetical protein DFJ74DRAFT_752211, partial [Hyaloraphidium curvatum]
MALSRSSDMVSLLRNAVRRCIRQVSRQRLRRPPRPAALAVLCHLCDHPRERARQRPPHPRRARERQLGEQPPEHVGDCGRRRARRGEPRVQEGGDGEGGGDPRAHVVAAVRCDDQRDVQAADLGGHGVQGGEVGPARLVPLGGGCPDPGAEDGQVAGAELRGREGGHGGGGAGRGDEAVVDRRELGEGCGGDARGGLPVRVLHEAGEEGSEGRHARRRCPGDGFPAVEPRAPHEELPGRVEEPGVETDVLADRFGPGEPRRLAPEEEMQGDWEPDEQGAIPAARDAGSDGRRTRLCPCWVTQEAFVARGEVLFAAESPAKDVRGVVGCPAVVAARPRRVRPQGQEPPPQVPPVEEAGHPAVPQGRQRAGFLDPQRRPAFPAIVDRAHAEIEQCAGIGVWRRPVPGVAHPGQRDPHLSAPRRRGPPVELDVERVEVARERREVEQRHVAVCGPVGAVRAQRREQHAARGRRGRTGTAQADEGGERNGRRKEEAHGRAHAAAML